MNIILLNRDCTERKRLYPLHLRLTERLHPLSTAEMTLPHEEPIALQDLVMLGAHGMYRVASVERTHTGQTVHLEHTLATLRDGLHATLSYSGSVAGCVGQLLSLQGTDSPRWALGDCETDLTVLFLADRENALDALLHLVAMLPEGFALLPEQQGATWLLHLRNLAASAPLCLPPDGLPGAAYALDTSRLCTRMYPYGAMLPTGRIDLSPFTAEGFLDSEATQTWGIISGSFVSADIQDAVTLRSVAQAYLASHASPGFSAHFPTEESFAIGQRVLLPLKAEGVMQTAYAVQIERPDLIRKPEEHCITLADRVRNAKDEIAALLDDAMLIKLQNGQVTTQVFTNRASGTADSPIVHYFDVEDGASLLGARFAFDPDDYVTMKDVRIDDTYLLKEVWQNGSFEGLSYLWRNEMNQVTSGEHRLILYPSGGSVASTVTLTVITH